MSFREDNLIEIANDYAWKFLGLPYIWGGDNPLVGFDCSGLCVEILKGIGKLPRSGDWGATALSGMFPKVLTPSPGCMVFYGSNGKIEHVEWCYTDALAIGASGGGSATVDVPAAIKQDAYIKLRPIKRDRDIICYVDPFQHQ